MILIYLEKSFNITRRGMPMGIIAALKLTIMHNFL